MPKVDKDNYKPYFEISISKDYSPEIRRAIAQEIIDEIATRTESGLDADNKRFLRYNSKYAKEKGQSNVDLTFSGDMLASIELLQSPNGKIRIGFEKGYDGLGKVEGNILGTYGQDKPINRGRNFLGITDEDLQRILSNYPTDDKKEAKERAQEVAQATKAAREIAGQSRIDSEDDDT